MASVNENNTRNQWPPSIRPNNVPDNFELVEVVQRQGNNFVLIGWMYLDAESVKELHRPTTQI
jgi:hypothetical protein